MKAVQMHRFGGPEVLVYGEAPRPQPAQGEALVRVHAAGINPVDWKTRKGEGVARLIQEFPAVLGWDISGVVEEVGPGVGSLRPGDEVYGLIRFPQPGGGYAEYAAAPEEHLAPKPRSLDHVHAAAVPLAALTAWQALFDTAGLQPGQRVLIHAAAGGVGHFAVQLAKWKGAHVIGTASSRNVEFLRGLGADEVVDYTVTPFEEAVRDVDVVLDCVGGETLERSWQVLRPGGVLVTIVGRSPLDKAQEYGVRAERIIVRPDRQQLQELARLIDAGAVRPVVSLVLPLREAPRAHEISEEGHVRGKLVLSLTAES